MSGSASPMLKRPVCSSTDLIEEVRRRPSVWDRNDFEYRNRFAKDKAWRDICRALEPGYEELSPGDKHEIGIFMMRKWYNIRDAYKKCHSSCKKRKWNSSSSRPYIYADKLTFLDPVFESRSSRDIKHVDLEELGDQDQGEEEWLNVFELDQSEPAPKRIKTNLTYAKPETGDDNLVSVFVNLIEKEEDEDRAFFKSITPAVKSLSEEDKFTFRIQVMKLLNSIKGHGMKNESVSDASDME